jgi:hypothetical protein
LTEFDLFTKMGDMWRCFVIAALEKKKEEKSLSVTHILPLFSSLLVERRHL